MSLDVQVQILSVDTGNFYSNREASLHWLNHKLRIERNELKKKENEIVDTLFKYGFDKNDLESILNNEYDFDSWGDDSSTLSKLGEEYHKTKDLIKWKNKKIKESKNKLLDLLSNKIEGLKSLFRLHKQLYMVYCFLQSFYDFALML